MSSTVLAGIPWWRSLGTKIAATLAVLTAVVVVPLAVYVDYSAALDGRERLRVQALDQLDLAASWLDAFGHLRVGSSVNPDVVPDGLRGVVIGGRATLLDEHRLWAVQRLDAVRLLAVSVDAGSLAAQRGDLQRTLAAAVGVALLAGAGLGWLAGSRLSRRARRGAAAAGRIAEGEATVRAAQPGGDEVSALTVAVDHLEVTLTARVDRERAFTAMAAHELRTPVTALVSASELLGDDAAAGLVRGQVDRLRSLVTDLLEIARLDAAVPADVVPVDASEAVGASLALLPDPPRLEVVAGGTTVLVDQRRLDRVLANLVGNAVRHGRPPIVVRLDGATICVDDCGDGFPQWLLETGPSRFGADGVNKGHGLGLVIAHAQAHAMGAEMSLSNRVAAGDDPGGATAEVVLVESTSRGVHPHLRMAATPDARSSGAFANGF